MPAPFGPSRIKSILPAANSSICDKIRGVFIAFPSLFFQWFSYFYNEDGTVTDAAKADMGIATGDLNAPTGVTATDGASATTVTVTWSTVAGATRYDVYRSTANDSGTASRIGVDIAVTSYTDVAANVTPNQVYFYWVKAKTDTGVISAFSTSDSGYAGTNGSGTTITFDSSGTWTVPSGVISISELKIWGGGGAGGGGSQSGLVQPGYSACGGGGGGGGYTLLTNVSVTPGDVLTINVGSRGVAGGPGQSGQDGGLSQVFKPSNVLVGSANGGRGGSVGTTQGAPAGTGGTGTTANGGNGTAGTYDTPAGTAGAGGAASGSGPNAGGAGGVAFTAGSDGGGGRVTIKIG